MHNYEQLTEKQLVRNLTPSDLVSHARHIYLSIAKDLIKNSRHPDDILFGEKCLSVVIDLQGALDVWDI